MTTTVEKDGLTEGTSNTDSGDSFIKEAKPGSTETWMFARHSVCLPFQLASDLLGC